MSAVFKREFFCRLRSRRGYIYVSLFLFFIGISTVYYNLYGGSTQIENSVSIIAIFSALIAPLITVGIFSSEEQNGTDKLLASLPLRSWDIVLGKYLAALAISAIPMSALAILPLIFNFFGEVNLISSYACVLAFALSYAATLSTLIFIDLLSKNHIVSLILSCAEALGSAVFVVTYIYRFLFEVFDITYLILLFSTAVTFLLLTKIHFKKEDARKKWARAFLSLTLIVVFISANILLIFVPKRYVRTDLSHGRSFSISQSTKEYIAALDDKVSIYIINADDSQPQLEHFISLFDEYSDSISVRYRTQDMLLEELLDLGWDGRSEIAAYTILIESPKRSQIILPDDLYYYVYNGSRLSSKMYDYYYNLFYKYASENESYLEQFYSFLSGTEIYFCGENTVAGCIEYTLLDAVPHAYYLIGHGEPDPASSALCTGFKSYGVNFEPLDLSSSKEIPSDANCLIIAAPAEDISEFEAQTVSAYLRSGGALTILTDEANLKMKNLMSIVGHYGLSAKEGLITVDKKSTDTDEAFNKHLFTPTINPDHDSLYELEEYNFSIQNANAILLPDQSSDSVIISKILTTPKDAYVYGDSESKGAFAVALALEEETPEGTTELAWFTGADSFTDTKNGIYNSILPSSTVQWSADQYVSVLAELDDKLQTQGTLGISATLAVFWGFLVIIALPAGVMTVGELSRKKRIKA